MVRERGLIDEVVSIRLIDFMAAAKAILDETLHPLAASDDRFYRSLAIADEHLVAAVPHPARKLVRTPPATAALRRKRVSDQE